MKRLLLFLLSAFCFLLVSGCQRDNLDITPLKDRTPFRYTNAAARVPQVNPALHVQSSKFKVQSSMFPTRPRCDAVTNPCPPARTSMRLAWDPVGPWPQFISYEIQARTNPVQRGYTVLGTTTGLTYTVWFTNGPQLYLAVAARDVALPNLGGGFR